jgi:hypothetical protein
MDKVEIGIESLSDGWKLERGGGVLCWLVGSDQSMGSLKGGRGRTSGCFRIRGRQQEEEGRRTRERVDTRSKGKPGHKAERQLGGRNGRPRLNLYANH